MIDPTRLYPALLNTRLQSKDNPLYQVIYDLIRVLVQQQDIIDSFFSSSGSSGSQGIPGVPGIPGFIYNLENNDEQIISSPISYWLLGYGGIYYLDGNLTISATAALFKGLNSFLHNYQDSGTSIGLNTFLGLLAGNFTLGSGGGNTGGSNIGIGANALNALTTGNNNIAIGVNALVSNTSGSTNIAIGLRSMQFSVSVGNNIGVGFQTLRNNTGGTSNVALGVSVLSSNISGNENVGLGSLALLNSLASSCTAIGFSSLLNNTSGDSNTAVGLSSLSSNTIGNSNTVLGRAAGINIDNSSFNNVSGNQNVWLGFSAGPAVTTQLSSCIAIGYKAHNFNSNEMILGSPNFISSTMIPHFVGIGLALGAGNLPLANLHIAAGTASVNTAPIKINSGTNLSTPEVGTYEYNGNHYKTNGQLIRFPLGGTLFDYFVDAGNGTTAETDLYSDTTIANTLGGNGDKIKAEYGGVFVSSATATREIRIYFGGTAIFDTGALTLSLSSAWTAFVTIIRVSSTTVRYMISFTTEGAALAAYTAVGQLAGLTLSSTNIIKITGQAAGVGAATNDIVAKMGTVSFQPAA